MMKLIDGAGPALQHGNPLSPLVDGVLRSGNILTTWHQRHSERSQLAKLDDRLLADVGIDRADARREVRKPFWRR